VNAESPSGLTAGFVDAAQALGLPAPRSPATKNWRAARCGMVQYGGRRLLILDNVETCGDRSFRPRTSGGHVLITSRDAVFAEIGIAPALKFGILEK